MEYTLPFFHSFPGRNGKVTSQAQRLGKTASGNRPRSRMGRACPSQVRHSKSEKTLTRSVHVSPLAACRLETADRDIDTCHGACVGHPVLGVMGSGYREIRPSDNHRLQVLSRAPWVRGHTLSWILGTRSVVQQGLGRRAFIALQSGQSLSSRRRQTKCGPSTACHCSITRSGPAQRSRIL